MELLKNLEGLSADEQMSAVVELQKAAMKHLEEQKQASIGKSAEMVILGLKKIKSDFEAKFDSLNYDIQTKVASLKDGQQGLQGSKGEQGDRGLDGAQGKDGKSGVDGKDGLDGKDGVSVQDAKIDFDGSLVITLSDGREINVGEVVPVDVAQTIHKIQSGSGGDSQTTLNAIAALQATIATYGTMATQNANAVAITGGTINNTTIGATTPSTGVFTTLTATGQTSLGGVAGSESIRVLSPVATGSYLQVQSSSSAFVEFRALGTNSNNTLGFVSRGSGTVSFYTNNSTSNEQLRVSPTASAVNYVQVTGAATGNVPVISAQGSDTNIQLRFASKGNQGFTFFGRGGSFQQFAIGSLNNSVNYLSVDGAVAGTGPILSSQGSDTNIDLNLTTKGTGAVNLNTGNGNVLRVADSSGTVVAGLAVFGGTSAQNTVYVTPYGSAGTANTVLASKGAGAVIFSTNTNNSSTGSEQLRVTHTASAVNYVQVTGAATGGAVTISSQGSDATVSMLYSAKGSSAVHQFRTNGLSNIAFQITAGASAVNYINVNGAATGGDPVLAAQGSDTNIDLVLSPKGTGALQAQQTDSTATGGNARGANAVDWQTSRASASQVSSGPYAVIAGGIQNTSSSNFSVVSGGIGNTASGGASVVIGGQNNQASNTYAIAGGGGNQATGNYSIALGGYGITSAGFYSTIVGGQQNSSTSGSAVTTQSATMNGTTAVTLAASNANIKVGQYITGTYTAGLTYVAAVSGTSLTLSQAASGSGTSTLSFFTPHGVVVGGGNNQATGAYSFIGGGGDAGTAANRNVASGAWSIVGGGRGNTASGSGSFVGGGGTTGDNSNFGNTASGLGSCVVGGFANTASGQGAFIGSGYASQASGIYSFIGAGARATTRSIISNSVFSSNNPIADLNGASQAALLVLGVQTTDATATVLRSDAQAAGTTNQVILPNNSAYAFRGEIVSGVTGGGNSKSWTIEGLIKRGANAASTTLVGSTVTSMYADAGAVTWTIALSADTTNGGLAVTFTGQAATTIRTVAQIRTTEMTY